MPPKSSTQSSEDQKLQDEGVDYFLIVFYSTVLAMLVIGAAVAHHWVSMGVGL